VEEATPPDLAGEPIDIKIKFVILMTNLKRIEAALISRNISRYAGDGVPRFDCSIPSLQFDLRHWEAPTSRSLFASQYSEVYH
jgi:hypothetical protein